MTQKQLQKLNAMLEKLMRLGSSSRISPKEAKAIQAEIDTIKRKIEITNKYFKRLV